MAPASVVTDLRSSHCAHCHLRLPPPLLQQARRAGGSVRCPHCHQGLLLGAARKPPQAGDDADRCPGSSAPPAKPDAGTGDRKRARTRPPSTPSERS